MPLPLLPAREEEFLLCPSLCSARIFAARNRLLAEKSQHAVLKRLLLPQSLLSEINLGRFVADISDENGITEIQDRRLWKDAEQADFLFKELSRPHRSIRFRSKMGLLD